MNILILAAGYGTRLYPLTLKIAKPLIPINNKPILNFLVQKIEGIKKNFSIDKINLVCNNKFYNSFLEWQKKYSIEMNIINDGSNSERDKCGAVKDIRLGIDKEIDWLILGGDNIFEDSLIEFLNFSKDLGYPTIGIYDINDIKKASHFGVVNMDKENRIIDFFEKPKSPPSTLIASCIYYFPKNSLDFLDSFLNSNLNPDAAGTYISWLVKKYKVFGYKLKGKWLDIGNFNSLKEAEEIFK